MVPLEDDLTQYARVLVESCFAVHNVMVAKIFYKTFLSKGVLFEFCNQTKVDLIVLCAITIFLMARFSQFSLT
jgi:hypothetical protein